MNHTSKRCALLFLKFSLQHRFYLQAEPPIDTLIVWHALGDGLPRMMPPAEALADQRPLIQAALASCRSVVVQAPAAVAGVLSKHN